MCVIRERDKVTKSPRFLYKVFTKYKGDKRLYSPYENTGPYPVGVWIKEKSFRSILHKRRKYIYRNRRNPHGFQGFTTLEGIRYYFPEFKEGSLRVRYTERVLRRIKVREPRATGYYFDGFGRYRVAIVGEMNICTEKETREYIKRV